MTIFLFEIGISDCKFFQFGLTVSVKTCKDFWSGKSSPVPAWLCPSAKSKVYKGMVGCVWRWRTLLAHTEPWPQPHQTPLGWIRTEITSQAFSCVWPHKSSSGWSGKTLHSHTPKSCKKSYQKSESCYSCKRGTNSILIPLDLEWYIIKAPVGVMCRCPNTFVHIVHITFKGTRGHWDLDFQAPQSNQFINESNWMYLPNLKTLPQADLKISHLKNSTDFDWPLWPWHLAT